MDVFLKGCASLCFATLCFAKFCLRFVRFDVQVADRNVKEVYMKRKCVHYCAVEALRLRKKRVKTLSLCRRKYYVNVMTRRTKHALARLQLALYASIKLNSGLSSFQDRVYIDDACGQWSEDLEYEEVQS